ncbi:hypothetical protein [Saccharolobus shibatae]|uniref:Thermopsin n=1 Tax=Saccharolobus shibatae TaxID=2286 RepID=A0A8F5C159_9CREN|nr:hypothetical protein [Saccharolobus shibatae]QXJ35060.1 hypothetical protein J5U22_01607 [Saccharolobus shibatae]
MPLLVYVVENDVALPLISYQYPYSQFAGTTINIYLYLSSNGDIVAQFTDGSFSYTYNTGISFTPYSALVMGEAPGYYQSGVNKSILFYPIPNETFSGISFNIIGSPATAVGYETIKYVTNYPITNNWINSNETWAFAWLSSNPSFSANAYTSSSSAQISGTLQLSYTETPLVPAHVV